MTVIFDKRRLIVTLGEDNSPASFAWEGVKRFVDDATGEESKPELARVETDAKDVDTTFLASALAATEKFNAKAAELYTVTQAAEQLKTSATELLKNAQAEIERLTVERNEAVASRDKAFVTAQNIMATEIGLVHEKVATFCSVTANIREALDRMGKALDDSSSTLATELAEITARITTPLTRE